MYITAIDYGVSPEDFWNYSIGEIQDILLSRQRVRTQKAKEIISDRHELAGLIGLHVYKMFDSNVIIPAKWDMYPELFAEEKKQFETERRKHDLEEARISRCEYARAYNRQRSMQGIIT